MFIYWGSNDSGKAHVKHYAKVNNKTNLLWMNNEIRKIKTTTHINEISWTDETIHRIIYHDLDGFRKCEKIENRIWEDSGMGRIVNGTIKPVTAGQGPKSPKRKRYSEEHIQKYTQKEYINTSVYFDMITKYNKFWGDDGICKPLTHETLKNHYDEILEDVDLITFVLPDWAIDALVDVLRNSVNIIPFKSNKLDSVISKLDHFKNQTGGDLFEVYDTDKNRVWHYLDWYQKEIDNILHKLTIRDIPYQMFDLDTASYPDTFGWQVDVDRKLTHRGKLWDHENYERVVKIAKEYITRFPDLKRMGMFFND